MTNISYSSLPQLALQISSIPLSLLDKDTAWNGPVLTCFRLSLQNDMKSQLDLCSLLRSNSLGLRFFLQPGYICMPLQKVLYSFLIDITLQSPVRKTTTVSPSITAVLHIVPEFRIPDRLTIPRDRDDILPFTSRFYKPAKLEFVKFLSTSEQNKF